MALLSPTIFLLAAGTAQCHKEERGAQHPRVHTSVSLTPQELKHKILLKGKKIGRLEDTLDGPGDEAPDVSDDDNGAEAEEEKRRMKVGGLGWGLGTLWASLPGPCCRAGGADTALLYRRTGRAWHRRCLTALSTARMCPSGVSRRPATTPGLPKSPLSLRQRPGSSSGMQVRWKGQQRVGSGLGWRAGVFWV